MEVYRKNLCGLNLYVSHLTLGTVRLFLVLKQVSIYLYVLSVDYVGTYNSKTRVYLYLLQKRNKNSNFISDCVGIISYLLYQHTYFATIQLSHYQIHQMRQKSMVSKRNANNMTEGSLPVNTNNYQSLSGRHLELLFSSIGLIASWRRFIIARASRILTARAHNIIYYGGHLR